jgi:hypothetical protein
LAGVGFEPTPAASERSEESMIFLRLVFLWLLRIGYD